MHAGIVRKDQGPQQATPAAPEVQLSKVKVDIKLVECVSASVDNSFEYLL